MVDRRSVGLTPATVAHRPAAVTSVNRSSPAVVEQNGAVVETACRIESESTSEPASTGVTCQGTITVPAKAGSSETKSLAWTTKRPGTGPRKLPSTTSTPAVVFRWCPSSEERPVGGRSQIARRRDHQVAKDPWGCLTDHTNNLIGSRLPPILGRDHM